MVTRLGGTERANVDYAICIGMYINIKYKLDASSSPSYEDEAPPKSVDDSNKTIFSEQVFDTELRVMINCNHSAMHLNAIESTTSNSCC